MATTAAQIAQLRRWVAEPSTATYSDADLTTLVESFPVMDELGREPYAWDYSTTPPTLDENDDWVATYDLRAAAAEVCEEKAAAVAARFDFAADGANFSRSQEYDHWMKQARYHAARRRPGTIRQQVEPHRSALAGYPINYPEQD